jgi:hypothetical protein
MKSPLVYINAVRYILITFLTFFFLQLAGQNDQRNKLPQYLFPDFSPGIVIKKNGVTQKYELNYNTVTQKMVFVQEYDLFDMTGTESIDTIVIEGRKFVPVDEVFFEVLVVAPVSLLLQHRSDLIPVGSPAGYGSTSQTSAIDNYVGISTRSGTLNLKIPDKHEIREAPTYWVVDVSNRVSFINRNQFLKAFAPDREKLEVFIKKNKVRFENPSDVADLIEYFNEIK